MEEAKELQLSIRELDHQTESNGSNSSNDQTTNSPKPKKGLKWWTIIAVYSLFLLAGQAAATLLGRVYFDKGGNSKWMATVVQLCGFPIQLPYYIKLVCSTKNKTSASNNRLSNNSSSKKPSMLLVSSVYVVLGLIIALDCYLYSVGLMYLPVSTYSLICASQLAFNALFSFFLNSQKFTPYIVNSLVLLTLSSVLLVFNSSSEDNPGNVARGKYVIGFISTIGASAGYALVLSLTQFFLNRVLKRNDFRAIMDVVVWQCAVASAISVMGLFASGEWKGLRQEMNSFELGKVSYVMNLTWTAITWQLFSIGNVGLIAAVSSLFSNVISVLGLPVIPVLAVFIFGEKMSGLKGVAMFLAIWGFVSYTYQNYLDDKGDKGVTQTEKRDTEDSDSQQRERDQ